MGHAHAHAHAETDGTFFLDQLFTILASGAVGVVAILMYQTGMLGRILVPMFFPWVLLGGVAMLLMACVRAVAVWQLAGARRASAADAADYRDHGPRTRHSHGHGHDHAHSHGEAAATTTGTGRGEHDHGHSHAHSHAAGDDDHGHDHGWAPWRYMVIAMPVFLYFLGLPREGFSDWPGPTANLKGPLARPKPAGPVAVRRRAGIDPGLRKSQPRAD